MQRLYEDDHGDFCEGYDVANSTRELRTIITNSLAAALFFGSLCFGVYIFVKYLLIKNKC